MPHYLIDSDAFGYRSTFIMRASSPQQANAMLMRVLRKRSQDHVWARYEHAFLLRCEGLTYRAIGDHLGVTVERARQMVTYFVKRMNVAMSRAHAHVQ